MKTKPLLAFALAVWVPAHAADPVFSDPVGFVKLGNAEADGTTVPAVEANSEVRISIPLENTAEFTGTVSATTATTISISGTPGWTANEWVPVDGQPHCAVISSGTENGLRCVITGNTADQLTVTVTSPGDITQVANGDTIVIRKCWTLATVFADSDVGDDCVVLLYDSTEDKINQLSSISYVHFGGTWYLNESPFTVSDHVVLYPGESFLLRSGSTPISTLSVFGDVPTSKLRNSITRGGTTADDNHVGIMSPVPVSLGLSGLPASNDDVLLVYDNDASGVNKLSFDSYVFFGGRWYQNYSPFNDVTDTYELEPGAGYIYRRASTAPASEEWTQDAP